MRIDETAEECAKRELSEETGLDIRVLKQLGAFSGVHRDPRERVVSVAFYALVRSSEVTGGDDARRAEWFPIEEVPQLAFDHDFILRKAMQQLHKDIYFEPVGFELLDRAFTMSELQRLYESILGVRFDRRNFEKKMLQTGILQPSDYEYDEINEQDSIVAEPPLPYYGKKQEMKRKSIDALFGASCEDVATSLGNHLALTEDYAMTRNYAVSELETMPCATPPKRKPGRKGRRFSFNKEEYDKLKQNNNFRFEF